MAKTLYVHCAFCQGMMEIDAETGEIIKKWEPSKEPSSGEDKMTDALKKISDAKKKRVDLFDRTRQQMDESRRKLEDQFRDHVDRVKKEGIDQKPPSPFDLD